ncbi:MAG: beta-galactosidase [Candidatus Parcubacteria bacterium]|nr:beta-galactosidase [Candidatus Parcubacteria bacterium]
MILNLKIILIIALLLLIGFFFIPLPKAGHPVWGVNFSQKQAEMLSLDWKKTYLAILDDLKVRNIKLPAHWDLIEPQEGSFDFNDLDWQIKEAGERNAKILLVLGIKTTRWPECHIPDWAKNLSKEKQQERILEMIQIVINRYKNSDAISSWQVENEPFLSFGDCPWQDENFLRKEVSLVKQIDSARPIIISASGEWSSWLKEAELADKVAITMYRIAWFPEYNRYLDYYFPQMFYWIKSEIVNIMRGKNVIVGELQAEPWGKTLLSDSSLEEQIKTMNLDQFKENIAFAEGTGFNEFYLWGSEWWYWMKEKQNKPDIWLQAQNLF